MDARYTTNNFGYILIYAIGVNNISQGNNKELMNFFVSLAGVADEMKDTYKRIFEASKEKIVFMVLLSLIFHIAFI